MNKGAIITLVSTLFLSTVHAEGEGSAALGAASILFFLVMFIIPFLVIGIGIFSLVFWILMLVDCAKREFDEENEKITWILVLALTGIIGAIIYYFMVKRKD